MVDITIRELFYLHFQFIMSLQLTFKDIEGHVGGFLVADGISGAELYRIANRMFPDYTNLRILFQSRIIPYSDTPLDLREIQSQGLRVIWNAIKKPITCRLMNGRQISVGEFASNYNVVSGSTIWIILESYFHYKLPESLLLSIGLQDNDLGRLINVPNTPDSVFDLKNDVSFHIIAMRRNMGNTGGTHKSKQKRYNRRPS